MSKVTELQAVLREIRQLVDDAMELLTSTGYSVTGTMSTFGGPDDMGVSPSEGLALIEPSEVDEFDDDLFLPEQPEGTTGLARRLNPDYYYIAMRWDYDITPRDWLQDNPVTVSNPRTGKIVYDVQPVDWGPHEDTGRVADLSPGLAEALDLSTDDECQVTVPIPEEAVA